MNLYLQDFKKDMKKKSGIVQGATFPDYQLAPQQI